MTVLTSPIAADSSYTTAVFGMVGVLIGAVIAGGVGLWTQSRPGKRLSALGFGTTKRLSALGFGTTGARSMTDSSPALRRYSSLARTRGNQRPKEQKLALTRRTSSSGRPIAWC